MPLVTPTFSRISFNYNTLVDIKTPINIIMPFVQFLDSEQVAYTYHRNEAVAGKLTALPQIP